MSKIQAGTRSCCSSRRCQSARQVLQHFLQPALRYLLLASILFLHQAHATPLQLNQPDINLTEFRMAYFIDASESLGIEDIIRQPFQPSGNKLSLGTAAKSTWARIDLQNTATEEKTLYLHHPYAYHNQLVGFYAYSNNELLEQQIIDMDTASQHPLMYRGSAVFPFTMQPAISYTIYVHSHSYSHQWFTLELLDKEHSIRALLGTHNDIALLTGVLLALIFYNFLLYFYSSRRENIYYSLYLASGAIWIALSYGLFANAFNLYGTELFKLHITLLSMPIFLILFMMAIFSTRQDHPTEHRFLQLMLILLALDFVYALFDIQGALKPASTLAALMMLITISVTISLVIKGNLLARFFLIGHTFFLIFNGIAVLFYKGMIDFTYIASHGVGIGIALESLMLSFIIAYRIRMLESVQAAQKDLKLQASTDPLTQLYNRRYFYQEASHLVANTQQEKIVFSLLAIDIDHFKIINDQHGHPVGDQVLIELAKIMLNNRRSTDLVARFGGEEFMILLPDCNAHEGIHIAEDLRQAVKAAVIYLPDGQSLTFCISIGVAEYNHSMANIDDLISEADQALYQAKHSGRDQVRGHRIPQPA